MTAKTLKAPATIAALLLFGGTAQAQRPGELPAQRGLETVNQPVVTPQGATGAPHCPDWTDKDHHPGEQQARNFGCATASNFAAMIADPMDLVRGRHNDGTDPDSATKAVRAWRETPPSGRGGTIDKVSAKGS